MTNPLYGPSLFQARKTDHVHHPSHLHNRKSDNIHARSHAEFHKRRDETADLDPRDSTITEVVQTISVVQIIDGSGATLSAQTVTGSSRTDLVDGDTGSTIAVMFKDAVTTSTAAEAATTSSSVTAVSTADPVSVTSDSTVSSTDTSIPSTTGTISPPELSLTHISSSSSTFSTLSSVSNSTTSSFTLSTSSSFIPPLLSSSIPPTNSSQTAHSDYASSTYLQSFFSSSSTGPSASSTTLLSSILTSTPSPSLIATSTLATGSSSAAWLSPSDSASATGGSDGSGGTTASAGPSSSTSTSASSGSSSSGTSPQTSEVVGGIFGGIAGVALLVALAVMILRLKKRGWCHLRLGGEDDGPEVASRALPASGGGDGSGAYGTMQRSAPQAVAASLAALAGKRTSRDRAGSGPEMAERGFVRVSGKKLPPVLQYGGDGYTDPRGDRNSQASEASASVYRDSIAVFDQPNHTRLALGSPMRPESGIMKMHPGPARIPVTNQAPGVGAPSLPRSSTFPSTEVLGRTLASEDFSRDAIGRTLAAHDDSHDGAASRGSRGSHTSRGSGKFTEHVS